MRYATKAAALTDVEYFESRADILESHAQSMRAEAKRIRQQFDEAPTTGAGEEKR